MTEGAKIITYAVWITRFNNGFNVASTTLLLFDYLLTLDHEIELIWKSRWNLVKVLYLLARYLPFIDTAMVLYHQFAVGLTGKQCAMSYQYSAWMFAIGISIAELLLTLRTWAVWEKDRRLTIGLPVFFAGFCVTEWVMVGLYLKPLKHTPSPIQPWMICLTRNVNQLLSVCWVVLMAYDAGIFALIVVQAWRTFRSWGNVPLIRIIYQDGIIYFAYLFCLSFLNVIIILRLPSEYVNLLSLLERVVHSVLTCRIILHIRHQTFKHTQPQELEEIYLKDLTI